MTADRFDRFLPLAGALIGLLFFVGLALTSGDPSSETAPGRDLLLLARQPRPTSDLRTPARAPDCVPARLLRRRPAATTEARQRRRRPRKGCLWRRTPRRCSIRARRHAGSSGDERCPRRPAASRLHAQPAPLIRPAGVERSLRRRAARDRPRCAPQWNAANALAWATIVIGASLLTPLGFFGFFLVPLWLIVVGLMLNRPASQALSEHAASSSS